MFYSSVLYQKMKGCCSFKAIVDGVCVHSHKDRNCSVTYVQ